MLGTGQSPHPAVAAIARDNPRERGPGQKLHQLREQRLAGVHRRVLPEKWAGAVSQHSSRHHRKLPKSAYRSVSSGPPSLSEPDSSVYPIYMFDAVIVAVGAKAVQVLVIPAR